MDPMGLGIPPGPLRVAPSFPLLFRSQRLLFDQNGLVGLDDSMAIVNRGLLTIDWFPLRLEIKALISRGGTYV